MADAAAVGPERLGPLPPRRPGPDLARRRRRPRRGSRGDGKAVRPALGIRPAADRPVPRFPRPRRPRGRPAPASLLSTCRRRNSPGMRRPGWRWRTTWRNRGRSRPPSTPTASWREAPETEDGRIAAARIEALAPGERAAAGAGAGGTATSAARRGGPRCSASQRRLLRAAGEASRSASRPPVNGPRRRPCRSNLRPPPLGVLVERTPAASDPTSWAGPRSARVRTTPSAAGGRRGRGRRGGRAGRIGAAGAGPDRW